MKNSAIKIMCLSFAFGIAFSCDNRGDGVDNEYENDSLVENSRSGALNEGTPDNDTTLNFREGINPNDGQSATDTVQLPQPILQTILNDNELKNATIVDKMERMENGETLFTVVFNKENGQEERVTFDAQGNRKSNP